MGKCQTFPQWLYLCLRVFPPIAQHLHQQLVLSILVILVGVAHCGVHVYFSNDE